MRVIPRKKKIQQLSHVNGKGKLKEMLPCLTVMASSTQSQSSVTLPLQYTGLDLSSSPRVQRARPFTHHECSSFMGVQKLCPESMQVLAVKSHLQKLRILAMYEAKNSKICNFRTF